MAEEYTESPQETGSKQHLEQRIVLLEEENRLLKQRMAALEKRYGRLPSTDILSPSFLTRALSIFGHALVPTLLLSIAVGGCLLVYAFTTGAGLPTLSILNTPTPTPTSVPTISPCQTGCQRYVVGCDVKGIIGASGRYYYLPENRFYEGIEVRPGEGDRWFCSAEEAERNLFRSAQGNP